MRVLSALSCLRHRRHRLLKVLIVGICCFSAASFLMFKLDTRRLTNIIVQIVDRDNVRIRDSGQRCVHPDLNPFDSTVMQFFEARDPVDCSAAMENWVYITNGTFRISTRARRRYGKIICEYSPLVRVGDFSTQHAPHVKPMLDGMPLQTDFFKVACVSASGHKYLNIHSGIAWNKDVHNRLEMFSAERNSFGRNNPSSASSSQTTKVGDKPSMTDRLVNMTNGTKASDRTNLFSQELGLNVFLFGFDSLSRMAWIRSLPKARKYFLKTLNGIELEGYNILGDGTPAALLPFLTGHTEKELPEARRGFKGARTVDNHPWIWNEFKRHGYVTAYAEDMASCGTFQYRMLGFDLQPTDHYMRPFYLAADRMYKHNLPHCLGSLPRHVNFMNWFRDLFSMYRQYPKFFFGFHGEQSHDNCNDAQVLDGDLLKFLSDLEKDGHLNSTLLILLADHGARYSYLRETVQGKLEERMPYYAFRFPDWFHRQHPEIIRNLKTNAQRLTTPYDIHATLLEVLNYTGPNLADLSKRGISLFKEIPKSRTCTDAGVGLHWCACLEWQKVNQSDKNIEKVVQASIDTINSFTEKHRSECALLKLLGITRSFRYIPDKRDFFHENKLEEEDFLKDVFQDPSNIKTDSQKELYQVSFITEPGHGHFEVTCIHDVISGKYSISSRAISRINEYGSDPECVQQSFPHLRPYCYCLKREGTKSE